MDRLFQISAAILAGIAAYFLWQGNKDATFISAVFGAVCYFLSLRFQFKEKLKQREEAEKRTVNKDNEEAEND